MTRFADLPTEVLDLIGHHLDSNINNIKSLILVSTWLHHHFLYLVWKHVTIRSKSPPAFLNTLQKHAHFVRYLRIKGGAPKDYYQTHFPGLVGFEHVNTGRGVAKGPVMCRNTADFFRRNPTIQDIIISPQDLVLDDVFWDAIITSLHNPRRLSVATLRLGWGDVVTKPMNWDGSKAFWRACCRFEEVEYVGWDHAAVLRSDITFNCLRLRRLDYTATAYAENVPQLWRWMVRCSNLTRLHWGGMVLIGRVHAGAAESPVWPHLEDLSLGDVQGSDEELARAMFSKLRQPLKHLRLEHGQLGPVCFGVLRERHFASLRTLSMRWCSTFTSLMVLEVLQKCVNLEVLEAKCISLRDLRLNPLGSCWTCPELKVLRVAFESDRNGSAESDDNHLLFEQLSRLTRLEELDMSRYSFTHVGTPFLPPSEPGPQLRLDSGLDQLSALRGLRKVRFLGSEQDIGIEDVEWMLEHWPVLEVLEGMLSCNVHIDKWLSAIIRERGIVC